MAVIAMDARARGPLSCDAPFENTGALITGLVMAGQFLEAEAMALQTLSRLDGLRVYESALLALVASDNQGAASALVGNLPLVGVRNAMELRILSAEAGLRNKYRLSLFLALAAVTKEPDNAEFQVHLGSLLCHQMFLLFCEKTLRKAIALDSGRSDSHRILSSVLATLKERANAIKEIEFAISIAPEIVDYRLHAAGLYLDGEFPQEALYHIACGLALDPGNHLLWRLMSAAYLQIGKHDYAISAATRAVAFSDAHREYRENLLLNYGGENPLARPDASPAPQSADFAFDRELVDAQTAKVSTRQALRTQRRVIWALMMRESRTIYGASKLGYLWAIFEPLSHLGLLFAVFVLIGHAAKAPIGDNMLVFYFSGLLPYLCFSHGTEKAMHVIANNASILGFSKITVFDVVMGRTLLSIVTDIAMLFVIIGIFLLLQILPSPGNALEMAESYLFLIALTIGIALLNSVISSYFDAWEKIWPTFLRLQYFGCGLFYHPSSMPEWVRTALSYNPLFHVLEWFREGFFHDYYSEYLDRGFLVVVSVLALALGFCVQSVASQRLKGRV